MAMSLQNSVDLHPSDLSKLLRRMRDEGKLIASGFGRGTTYRLNRSYVASSDVASSDVAGSGVASSEVSSSGVASSDEENVNTMIKEICKYQWLSSREISLRIGRHPTHVRRIIRQMVDKGEIKQEYPNQPTHPGQRYRII